MITNEPPIYKTKNPLRLIINATIFCFFILFATYIGLKSLSYYGHNISDDVIQNIEHISHDLWQFISPILQLGLILLIIDWILSKLGINTTLKEPKITWSVQTVIGIIIIAAFAISALANLNKGLDYLKDLALVVVGFYFGTQRKKVEIKDDTTTITEEHVNPEQTNKR